MGIDFRSESDVGNVVKNNIIYTASGTSDPLVTQGNKIIDYNLYYPSKDSDDMGTNSRVGDPSFNDISKGDFSLKTGSVAIDSGVNITLVTNDFIGTNRPKGNKYDIGAYEHVSSDTTPPGPPMELLVQ